MFYIKISDRSAIYNHSKYTPNSMSSGVFMYPVIHISIEWEECLCKFCHSLI